MKIFKNKIFLVSLALIITVILASVFFGGKKELPYETALVQKGDIIQEVSVTGNVKPKENVDLAFEISGRVASVDISVGDKIKKGDRLAGLDSSDIDAKFAQALAGVEAAKATLKQYEAAYSVEDAKLTELKKGARPEDIQVSETRVSNAKKSLSDAGTKLDNIKEKAVIDLDNLYNDVDDILNDAYAKADDAVSKQIVSLVSENSPNDFQITFSILDSSLENNVELKRLLVKTELSELRKEIDVLEYSYPVLDEALNKAENHLVVVRDFLSILDDVVDVAVGLTSTTKNTYKGYITTGRNNVNSEISDINTQKQNIAAQKITNQNNIFTAESNVNTKESNLLAAEDELSLKKAGSTKEQIEAQEQRVVQAEASIGQQEAVIKQSQANVRSLKAQIFKTIIYSPIDGTVTKQNAKAGQIVSPNTPLISIISEGQFEIEVNISEADIAKVKVGDYAKITLDAYGDDNIFEAEVVKIDPAETIIEGVSTYKTTLNFKNKDDRIRSGMTANIDILTGKKENVIKVPQRAVADKDGEKFIRVIKDNKPKEVKIKIGLRGSNGLVEVTDGLFEGDEIIVFEK
jgi:RND family efflux transporter MFP subunit